MTHGDIEKEWKHRSYGPKEAEPLLLFPGVSGSSNCFFRQFLSLANKGNSKTLSTLLYPIEYIPKKKGYRLIAVEPADYETHSDWCKGLDLFLEAISVKKGHFLGVGLGGYLIQLYLCWRSNNVLSLILCNSFCDTGYYKDRAPFFGMFYLTPLFMLQRTLLLPSPFLNLKHLSTLFF